MATRFKARISKIERLSADTSSFRFDALDETPFSDLTAGAHLDIDLPDGFTRQYSVFEWDDAGRWASVAVKREEAGRGGSERMHQLSEGQEVSLGGPRNNFELDETAPAHILIAGGIGVTPIYAMAARLKALGKTPILYYLTRSADLAAFEDKLKALELGEGLHLHRDEEHGFADFEAIYANASPGTQTYICGPEPMLQAALAKAEILGKENVRYERFVAGETETEGENGSFEVVLAKSGKSFQIGPDESILNVFLDNGVDVDFGCSEGGCGSCITDVLEGDVDHRDIVLTDDEHAENSMMCVCVSRAKGDRLVLDL